MASTNRSASPSSEGEYDILTPAASIPDTTKEPSERDELCMPPVGNIQNTATEFHAHCKFGRDLAKLERWVPTVGRLRYHELAQLSEFFREKTFILSQHLPTGTEEEQLHFLERLTKLRDGPLGIRLTTAAKELLNVTIIRCVGALTGDVPSFDEKVCYHTYHESCVLILIYLGSSMWRSD